MSWPKSDKINICYADKARGDSLQMRLQIPLVLQSPVQGLSPAPMGFHLQLKQVKIKHLIHPSSVGNFPLSYRFLDVGAAQQYSN